MNNNALGKWLVAAVLILGGMALFFGVDFMSRGIWEAELLQQAHQLLSTEAHFSSLFQNTLPAYLVAGAVSAMGWEDGVVRLPALLFFAASLYIFYQWGRKVLGHESSLWTVLLALGSFPLIIIGKIAVADAAGLTFAVAVFILTIFQLKKTNAAQWGLLALSFAWALTSPMQAAVFQAVFFAWIFFLHPSGNKIILPATLSILLAIGVGLASAQWSPEGFLWDYDNYFHGLVATGIGNIAVLGFIPAVLYHSYLRMREKEELAILTVSAGVAALLAASWLAHLLLLFLVGKQIQSCLQRNYPYGNMVKTATILQVVLTFFVALLAMMNGFNWMGGVGFRKALLWGTPLWAMGIYTLIAIYSIHQKHLFASILLNGVIANLLFWTQIIPLWEAERDIVKEVIRQPEVQTLKAGDTLLLDAAILDKIKIGQYQAALPTGIRLAPLDTTNTVVPDALQLSPTIQPNTTTIDTVKTRAYPWLPMKTYYWQK